MNYFFTFVSINILFFYLIFIFMAKQLLFLFVVIAALSSCTANSSKTAYTVDQLMDTITTQVDMEVKVRGTVNHVCKHSGMKCFIENENGDLSIQIMAGGIIKSFDNNLIGSDIEAVGVVREHRVEKDQIDETEKSALDQMHLEDAHEQCQAMLTNVAQMREWMKKNNKDYYAIYYIDGIRYKLL